MSTSTRVAPSELERLLTREEAADALRISTRTLDDMEAADEIQSTRVRGRVLYHPEDVRNYIESRRAQT